MFKKITVLEFEPISTAQTKVVVRGPTLTAVCDAAMMVLLASVGPGKQAAFGAVAEDIHKLLGRMYARRPAEFETVEKSWNSALSSRPVSNYSSQNTRRS